MTPGSRQPRTRPAVQPGVVDMESAQPDKLDLVLAKLGGVEARLGGVEAKLDGGLSEVVTSIHGLRVELGALDKRVAAVEAQHSAAVTRNADEIAQIKSRLKALEGAKKGAAEAVAAAVKACEEAQQDVSKLKKDLGRLKVGADVPCMARFRELHEQVQSLVAEARGETSGSDLRDELHALKVQFSELASAMQARPAAPPPQAPQAPEARVREALARELAALGPIVKVEGIVEHREGQSELQLCTAAAQALSSKVGGGAKVMVQSARWLNPPAGQGKPKRLMLRLGSEAMVRAVQGLKGKPGSPSRLTAGERVMSEYGAVEMAVRNVLFEEVRAFMGEGRAWVGRSCMFVNGKPQPLSDRAISAGFEALDRPRARPAPRAA